MRPDLTCLGKIIGGGLPVGAYGGSRELMSARGAARAGVPGGDAVGQSRWPWPRASRPSGRSSDGDAYERLERAGRAAGVGDRRGGARQAGCP